MTTATAPSAPQVIVEEKLVLADQFGPDSDVIAKMPLKLRKIIRLPNWTDDQGMYDEPPWNCCPSLYCCMTTVREGNMRLGWVDVDPKIYGPGLHNFNCRVYSGLRDMRTVSVRDDLIFHGPLKIMTVSEGKLGYGTEKGKNILFAPGRHVIRSNEFLWKGFLDLTQDLINIGEWQLIRVDFGRVGVATIQGRMKVLEPGIHMFEPPDVFLRFVNTRLQILNLPECIQESSDYVSLRIKANLSYHIKSPLLCIEQIQDQQAEKIITEVANSAIAAIIRSSTLGDMAMTSKSEFHGHDESKRSEPQREGEAFHERMHSRFMSTVGDQLLNTMGIEVLNINIEKLQISDKQLANQISSYAVKIAELESQHKTLEKEGEVKREQAKIELEVATANAQAVFVVAQKRADGIKYEQLTAAQAESEATKLQAEATAQMIKLQADAEIDAYIKRSKAECEYAEGMNQTDLSRELALINARLEGVKAQAEALEGTSQIAYVPHLPAVLSKTAGGIYTDMKEMTGVPIIPKMKMSKENLRRLD